MIGAPDGEKSDLGKINPMADFLTKAERSERMSRIKSQDTGPELALRKVLHKLGLRYVLGGSGLSGKPDLVFPRFKTVVFVHGCFWHRHPGCKVATTPKTDTEKWLEKFRKNVARDERVKSELEAMGWRVIIVWECELSSGKRARATGEHVAALIRQGLG